MSIRVECLECRSVFRVKDEYAGKSGKCPQCKARVAVPVGRAEAMAVASPEGAGAAADAASDETDGYGLADAPTRAVPVRTAAVAAAARAVGPAAPVRTPVEILAAFRGEIRPVRPTLLYRFWISIVAAVMLLLPLIYLGLIAAVSFAVYLHLTRNAAIFQHVRNVKAALLLYLGPLLAGVTVVGFMLKPLFARPAKRPRTKVLDPTKEPLLFAFVDGVCTSVGAPKPSRIEVDCEVNASASFGGGLAAWLTGDLVLTIGLPLVVGLDIRQFAGVLGHEFGHFSQRLGMRLSYLIRSINGWFARVVYERDEWDETLKAWCSDDHGAIIVLGLVARLAVWLTRRCLWVLMILGHLVSSFLLRQMEFDADRYEARLSGSDVFATTSRRLVELNLAQHGAMSDLATSWEERRLPDNLPKLILANLGQIPDEVRRHVVEASESAATGLFATHPANKDRIARARAEQAPGVFHLDGPASDVFRDFDGLARAVSYGQYRAWLGPGVTKEQLYPVTEALEAQAVAQEGREAFQRFFLGGLDPMQALPLSSSYPAAPADLKVAKQALVETRKTLVEALPENQAAREQFGEKLAEGVVAEAAAVYLKTGMKIKAADFGLDAATSAAANAKAQRADAARQESLQASLPYEQAAARRLELALGLLESEAVAARVSQGPDRRAEARALYPCAVHLGGRVAGVLAPVFAARQVLQHAAGQLGPGDHTPSEPAVNACLRAAESLRDRLQELQWRIGDGVAYPFEHAQEGIGLARFALPLIPDKNDIGALHQASVEVVDRISGLYHRVLGRLAVTAEEVERVLGLKPLESPATGTEPEA